MKTTILAAVTALSLAFAAAPAFAANHGGGVTNGSSQDSSSNIQSQCDNILANPSGYAAADVRSCRTAR